MDNVFSAVKVAINNGMNAAVTHNLGRSEVNALAKSIEGLKLKFMQVDCSVVDFNDFIISRVEGNGVESHQLPQVLLATEVLLVENLNPFNSIVNSMIHHRSVYDQALPNLKSVIVLYSSHDEMADDLVSIDGTIPVIVTSF